MALSEKTPAPSSGRSYARAAQVIVVSSVMFAFISYWRTAAVVLCDMSSTAYYIGGIVEQAIGPAAPWFILAVLLFSAAVGLVYVESCSLFVRGGVYRVVKNAMGGSLGKLAVSALMFDYILTGPISSVSAGQYIIGLLLDTLAMISPDLAFTSAATRQSLSNWGSVFIACAITLYFLRLNLLGIHESSEKALKIMIATTVMAVIMLGWCLLTLTVRGPSNGVPAAPDLEIKRQYAVVRGQDRVTGEEIEMWQRDEAGQLVPLQDEEGRPVYRKNPVTGEPEDPLGFLGRLLPTTMADQLRHPPGWLSMIGLLGLFLAFGHSILAMSGEETLAQVYREVESPKLPNFKKAAFIVFFYSLLVTGAISFLAVLLIPDEVRMKLYKDNLIGGLAMHMIGPTWSRLLLNAFVVVVGFLILSGAVNTAIIGSNGVLNRVAEDGVLTDWFLKPHRRYGTTYRMLYMIVGLQLLTIIVSGGDMYLLGEAYAFGVVWSFVLQALSMLVLRFKDTRPREFKVPLNVRVGKIEVPVGLGLIFVVLAITAVMNFLTKEVATVAGLVFTGAFMALFTGSERYHDKRRRGQTHEHIEQFNRQVTEQPTPASLGLSKPYRKLVAIRSPQNLFMLETALAETDPETTDLVVMTAKMSSADRSTPEAQELDTYDQRLMTAVVERAERAGKKVVPLIVPTNNPLHAVLRTAQELDVQELVIGASNKFTADEQLDQISFFWVNLHGGQTTPLTVRILSRQRDVYLDIAGGSRIPKISERRARSVAELRAAGVGADRVFLAHDGTQASSDLFQSVLTLLDPSVGLALVTVPSTAEPNGQSNTLAHDVEEAKQVERELQVYEITADWGPTIVRLAQEARCDLIIVSLPDGRTLAWPGDDWRGYVLNHAHCPVCLAARPVIPTEPAD